MDRVVGRLSTELEDLKETLRVPRCRLHRTDELALGKMIGARARHQKALSLDELQRQLIELAISRLSLRDVFLCV